MELFRHEKAKPASLNTIDIEFLCLSLTGNATSVIFDAIQQEDFDTGTMQRFDFWCYDGPIPERGFSQNDDNEDLVKFAKGIAKIRTAMVADGNLTALGGSRFEPYNIGITDKGAEVLQAWSKDVTARTNSAGSDGDPERNEKILLNCMNGEQYICYKNNPRHRYFRGWFLRV